MAFRKQLEWAAFASLSMVQTPIATKFMPCALNHFQIRLSTLLIPSFCCLYKLKKFFLALVILSVILEVPE